MKRITSTRNKKLPKYLTDREVSVLLKEAKSTSNRDWVILLTLYRTGLRVSELCNLTVGSVSFDTDDITVREGKGNIDRVVPLEEELGNILSLYCDGKGTDDKIFGVTVRWVQRMVERYREVIDRSDMTPHTLRHTFAVHCVNKGLNLRHLQKILGHSALTTTEVYLDVTATDVKDSFSVVDWD